MVSSKTSYEISFYRHKDGKFISEHLLGSPAIYDRFLAQASSVHFQPKNWFHVISLTYFTGKESEQQYEV